MSRITGLDVTDVRFPTSRDHDGSDAMNPEPDYSAAYLVLTTEDPEVAGTSLVFTTGRGNDIVCAALRALAPYVVGREVAEIVEDLGGFSRQLVYDGQLRWLGPEKGVMHMAIGGLVNAAWDLRARLEGRPLWEVLADLTPEEVVAVVDFSSIDDLLTPDDALRHLRAARAGAPERRRRLVDEGMPAYNTSAGWIGYADAKLELEVGRALDEGFTTIKLKVGRDLDEDRRRLTIARATAGPDVRIAIDANQRWGVRQAVPWIEHLADQQPYWVEEPTSPDDVLGHAAIRAAVSPVRIATGEHVANRIVFKQLIQAAAVDVIQIDACRVGGVNENVAILLLAATNGIPVCPHAGGVGLCEMVQHLAMFDLLAVGGANDQRVVEYVDHLHEHFVEPVDVRRARYFPPRLPGGGAQMLPASVATYTYPSGAAWAG